MQKQVEKWQHPTGNNPEVVHVVACGYTQRDYLAATGVYRAPVPTDVEVWAINKGLRGIRADFGFVLDDIVGEHTKCTTYLKDLVRLSQGVPILTSTLDQKAEEILTASARGSDSPTNNWFEYPILQLRDKLGEIFAGAYMGNDLTEANIKRFGNDMLYLKNSIPMVLAYAWFIGVKTVFLWGADYSHPAGQRREADQPNAEFWVGFLKGQGIQVVLSSDTTLCSIRDGREIYGYGARQPNLT